jgi:uncharacterized protein DUF4277
MATAEQYTDERLDHLGIVAGVCQEIGLAAWLDAQDPGNRRYDPQRPRLEPSSIVFGAAVLRQKPVEHLLGVGISAEMLNDDCLGRPLDWLYAHDPTKLFAGIASRARQIFGITAQHVHVDTTSFSVGGRTAWLARGRSLEKEQHPALVRQP